MIACSSGSTSTQVEANGESKSIPCPGSGCVGGYVFICDSDGNVNSYGRCGDGGVDAGISDAGRD